MAQEDAELIKVRCWLRPPEAGTSMPSGDTVTLSGSHPNADEQGEAIVPRRRSSLGSRAARDRTDGRRAVGREVTDIRVAVISSSLHEDMNVLWRATARLVDEQILIGPRSTASSGSVGQEVLPLADRDLGPNATWQRLSHLRSELRRFGPDLVHVNGELWSVRTLQVVASKYPFVAHGA